MVKHRLHIPFILVFSLSLGLIPDLFHALTYNNILSLVPVILSGFIIGSILGYGCVIWVRHHQTQGLLRLNAGATMVIVAYVTIIYVIPWSKLLTSSNGLCSAILAKDAIDCGYKLFVLQSTSDFILWVTLYIGGINFERKLRYRLIYLFPLWSHTRPAPGSPS